MTTPTPRLARLARLLVRSYPTAWRARYGEDMAEFLVRRSVRASDLPNLAFGAVNAYIQVLAWKVGWPELSSHARRGVVSLLAGWFLLSVAGAAVIKASEDGPVSTLVTTDQAAHVSLIVIGVAGLLGLGSMLLSAVRPLTAVLWRFRETRDWRGFALVSAPVGLAAAYVLATLGLPQQIDVSGRPHLWVGLWVSAGLACVAVSLACGSAALKRGNLSSRETQPAVPGAVMLALLALLTLAAEAAWLARLTTIKHWTHLSGVLGLSLPWSAVITVGTTVLSIMLTITAARMIGDSDGAPA